MKRTILITSLLFCSIVLFSQVASVGPARNTNPHPQKGLIEEEFFNTDIPGKNARVLPDLFPEEIELLQTESKPLRIGIVRDLPVPVIINAQSLHPKGNNQRDIELINDSVYALTWFIQSPEASSVRLKITQNNLPAFAECYIYDEDRKVFGPYRSSDIYEDGFWTHTLFTDYIYFQVRVPKRFMLPYDFSLCIESICHNTSLTESTNNLCYEDVNCAAANAYSGISGLKNAVAKITFITNGSSFMCSGGLLTTATTNFQPHFLTANHCLSTQAEAQTVNAIFDYRTTSCNSGTNITEQINGAHLSATGASSDFTLLLLSDVVYGTYLGWTAGTPSNATYIYSVTHPGGLKQKYTKSTYLSAQNYSCSNLPPSNYIYSGLNQGATAGGSSGGVVVNPSNQVIGQLYGKCYSGSYEACTYNTYYEVWGRFSTTYSSISTWLQGTETAGIYVNPDTWDYGTVTLGSSTTKSFTISNTSTNGINLDVSQVYINQSGYDFSVLGGVYNLYIQPGQSETITVEFDPTSPGSKSGFLTLVHNASNWSSPITIPLYGTGDSPTVDTCGGASNYGLVNAPSVTGETLFAYDEDWWKFEVPVPMSNVAVSLCGSLYDTKLEVFDDCGSPYLYYNDDDTSLCYGLSSHISIPYLNAGTYYVKVFGYSTGFGTYTLEVYGSAPLHTSATTTDVSCYGDSNGSIDLTVSGGTTPYFYNWSTGASTQDISNLSAGSYFVTVNDGGSNTVIDTFDITGPAQLQVNEDIIPVCLTSSGGMDGFIYLSVNGGTPPYSFLWSNGQTDLELQSFMSGMYSVTVSDTSGCAVTNSYYLDLYSYETIETISDVSCNGYSDGAIDISVLYGISGGYDYYWSTGETTEDISGLSAGVYTLEIIDYYGCPLFQQFTVSQPNELLTSGITTNVDCFGNANGEIDLTVTGGTAPYSYSWSNGATTEDIANIPAGDYIVVVSDNNGCYALDTFNLIEPAYLVLSMYSSDFNGFGVSCVGMNDGFIGIVPSGGVMPYTYSWNTGETTDYIDNLDAGLYQVTVTDANGCNEILWWDIMGPDPIFPNPTLSYYNGFEISCHGAADGSIDLFPLGGAMPYTFSWSNGGTTMNQSGLSAGNYNITVLDANGCDQPVSLNLDEPALLSVSGTVTHPTPQNNDGTVSLTVTGGIPPFSYYWSNGYSASSINSNLVAGTYTVTVTDYNGCDESASFVLTPQTSFVTQQIPVDNSWSLISFYIEPTNNALPSVFDDIMPYLQAVKKPGANWLATNPPILNDLNHILNGEAYWIKTNANCTIQTEGTVIDPGTFLVELDSGWNPVAYIGQQQQLVLAALADIQPVLVEVKARSSSWHITNPPLLNTLTTLKPGFGYFINVSADTSFYYPQGTKGVVFVEEEELPYKPVIYPNSTTMVGEIILDNTIAFDEGSMLLAKVDGEIRAVSQIIEIDDRHYASLVIGGLEQETVGFELITSKGTYTSKTRVVSKPGYNIAKFNEAKPILFKTSSEIEEAPLVSTFNVYPNPFKDNLTIRLDLLHETELQIDVYNSMGQKVRSLYNGIMGEGENTLTWDGLSNSNQKCAAGLYLVHIQGNRLHETKSVLLTRNNPDQ